MIKSQAFCILRHSVDYLKAFYSLTDELLIKLTQRCPTGDPRAASGPPTLPIRGPRVPVGRHNHPAFQ